MKALWFTSEGRLSIEERLHMTTADIKKTTETKMDQTIAAFKTQPDQDPHRPRQPGAAG
jgi:hypothetical protein